MDWKSKIDDYEIIPEGDWYIIVATRGDKFAAAICRVEDTVVVQGEAHFNNVTMLMDIASPYPKLFDTRGEVIRIAREGIEQFSDRNDAIRGLIPSQREWAEDIIERKGDFDIRDLRYRHLAVMEAIGRQRAKNGFVPREWLSEVGMCPCCNKELYPKGD
jgi:hypothetical protein